jgi:hypothetical protein
MKKPSHYNLVAGLGSLEGAYDQMREDQERDSKRQELAKLGFLGFVVAAAASFTGHWDGAPWLLAGAAIFFERTLWWSRELSHRNYSMHVLTFEIEVARLNSERPPR